MKTPSLIDILSENTTIREENANTFIDEVLEENPIINDEFAVPQPQKTVKEEIPLPKEEHFSAPAPEPALHTPKVEKPRLSASEYKESALTVIAIYDIFQTFTFPLGYKRAIFSKDEMKAIRDLKVRMRQDTSTTISEEEQILLDKLATFNDLRDNVPFTEDEITAISEPLAKVFAKHNIQLGPELLLISALGMTALPRIMPFFTGLEKHL